MAGSLDVAPDVPLLATNGDARRVREFSRHRSVQTVLTYWDAVGDAAGDVARLVAGEGPGG